MREITIQFEDDSFAEKLAYAKRNGYDRPGTGVGDDDTPADENYIVLNWILDVIDYEVDHEVRDDGND